MDIKQTKEYKTALNIVNKSKNIFTKENMLDFGKFCSLNSVCEEENRYYQYWELLNIWEKQKK